MLKILYRFFISADRAFASRQQLQLARERARHASALHGTSAYDYLIEKLRDPRRKQSRRELRLAIDAVLNA